MSQFDVLIAGGGMVGASLALALSEHSAGELKVALVEGFPLPDSDAEPVYSPSFDARSTALSYGSRRIYEALGLWPLISRHATPIRKIHVSDRGHFGSTTLLAEQAGWDALGYVIENAWLGRVLLSRLQSAKGLTCISPAKVTAAKPGTDGVTLTVSGKDGEQSIHSRLLVVADGAESGLRTSLGIATKKRDYHQTGVIANVCFEKAHEGCAYERFTDQGPLALLPLSDSEQGEARASLVWTLPPEEAQRVMALDDADFCRQLQTRFGWRQGMIRRVGERAAYPLALVEAEEQIRRHIVVMGNAAHSLHPVAGQGFNLALRDVNRLSRLLSDARAHTPLGDLALLKRYVDSQASDQWATVNFSDRVTRLFSNRQPLLSVARNLGLLALDVLPPARSAFVAQTAGTALGAANR